jgi:hypothetical protein
MVKWVRPAPEVDQPTYEIVGPVERFDMRDEAGVRVHLCPGSKDYEEYCKKVREFRPPFCRRESPKLIDEKEPIQTKEVLKWQY